MDPWDSRLYDMVLHIGNLTVDDAVVIAYFTVKKPCFQTTPASQKILDDKLLEAKVQAALVKTAPFAKVAANGGKVLINNFDDPTIEKKPTLKKIKNIVEKIEGVKEIHIKNNRQWAIGDGL